MPCVYIHSVCLLLAVLGINFVSIHADCESASSTGASLFSGCSGGGDSTCPSSCTDYLTNFHESCVGEVYGDEVYSSKDYLNLGVSASGACKEHIQNEFLTLFQGSTCNSVMDTNSIATTFICSVFGDAEIDDECSDFCKGIIDDLYATCASTDTWGGTTITQGAAALEIVRSDSCNTYAATKSFTDECPPASTTKSASITTPKLVSLVSLITLSAIFLI
mmetsp:Transcript_9677/g.11335  ORF Transcript_9677/g.11335 Transcript_9677/m.11335 type:complete len:220 (+) Transcript_9677:191-850(+)